MTTPAESQSRDYEVYVRGVAPSMVLAFTTTDTSSAYRGGIWHEAQLAAFPAPTDNEIDDFGIQAGGTCSIEIIDQMDDRDWPIEDESLDPILDENGDPLITEF